jgi:hypothetical protein
MSAAGSLLYRAGSEAYRLIREHGFEPRMIRTFAGPASGPKWLVLAGIDRAIVKSDLLAHGDANERDRTLLVGASAGGWRALALASPDPAAALEEFEVGYVEQVFGREVTPVEISEAYRRMLSGLLTDERIDRIVHNPIVDVALHVVRARGPAGSSRRRLQAAAMATAAALNVLSDSTMRWFFKRLLFHTRPASWRPAFDGDVVALTRENLLQAALATGTIPLYMQPVRTIEGVATGRYLDGGLTDYHLNQTYASDREGVVLFPHFQERIVPNWFDRYLPRRTPAAAAIANLLQIHPSPEFVAQLPDGRIPNRDDFIRFIDDPRERIRRWRQVSAASDRLGEQFLEDIEHGRVPERVVHSCAGSDEDQHLN